MADRKKNRTEKIAAAVTTAKNVTNLDNHFNCVTKAFYLSVINNSLLPIIEEQSTYIRLLGRQLLFF